MKQVISDLLLDITASAFAFGFGYILLHSFKGPGEVSEILSLYLLGIVPMALFLNGVGQTKSRRVISTLEKRIALLEEPNSNLSTHK